MLHNRITSALCKIKEEFPDFNAGRIFYFISTFAEDKGIIIRDISDDEFLSLIDDVYNNLKAIKDVTTK